MTSVDVLIGDMVELVDTLDSGSSGSNTVRVRVSLSPQEDLKRRDENGKGVGKTEVSPRWKY